MGVVPIQKNNNTMSAALLNGIRSDPIEVQPLTKLLHCACLGRADWAILYNVFCYFGENCFNENRLINDQIGEFVIKPHA